MADFVPSDRLLQKAYCQLVTLLFRKSSGKNKSQICHFSRFFSCKAKKTLVANANVLVTILSPAGYNSVIAQWNLLKAILFCSYATVRDLC